MTSIRSRALLLLSFLAVSTMTLAHGDENKSCLEQARQAARDGRVKTARGLYQAMIRHHLKVERANAAAALLALGELEEESGQLSDARSAYGRVSELFPERRGDINVAEARLRAIRQDGGQFLTTLLESASKARGKTRLEKMATIVIEGELVIGKQQVKIKRFLTRNPTRMREDAPALQLSKAWNGKQGWLQKGSEIEDLKGPRLDRTVSWAFESLAQLMGEHDGKAEYAGMTRVLGRKAYRIQYRSNGETWVEDIDAETYLPSRAEGSQIDAKGQTSQLTLYYHDWKNVDGAYFPGKVEYYKGDKLAYEFQFKSYKLDSKLDKTLFDRPNK